MSEINGLSNSVGNERKGGENEKINKENALINRVREFNMGWFNVPKSKWRTIGVVFFVIGAFLIFFTDYRQYGVIIAILGAIINLVNG
ncbi:MAG: hypothetical protein ABIE23_03245 [archaeon]